MRKNAMSNARFDYRRTRRAVLRQRESLVLENAQGAIIAVDRGCLWITLEHDLRDIVLVKGMRFQVDRSGRTVIAAEADSTLRVLAPVTLRQRLTEWLGRTAAQWLNSSTGRLARRAVPYF